MPFCEALHSTPNCIRLPVVATGSYCSSKDLWGRPLLCCAAAWRYMTTHPFGIMFVRLPLNSFTSVNIVRGRQNLAQVRVAGHISDIRLLLGFSEP